MRISSFLCCLWTERSPPVAQRDYIASGRSIRRPGHQGHLSGKPFRLALRPLLAIPSWKSGG
jgi:hypothetical protein